MKNIESMNIVGVVPGTDPKVADQYIFSGRPGELHAPTDDPETIDYEKTQRISQLAYEVTAELGNRDRSIRPPSKAPSKQGPG